MQGKRQKQTLNEPRALWQRVLAGERLPKRLSRRPKCEGTVEDHRASRRRSAPENNSFMGALVLLEDRQSSDSGTEQIVVGEKRAAQQRSNDKRDLPHQTA